MAKKKAEREPDMAPTHAHGAAPPQAHRTLATASSAQASKGRAKANPRGTAQHAAAQSAGQPATGASAASSAAVPARWNPWRTTLLLLLLIALLGIVPVALGGIVLGWWHVSNLLPLLHPLFHSR